MVKNYETYLGRDHRYGDKRTYFWKIWELKQYLSNWIQVPAERRKASDILNFREGNRKMVNTMNWDYKKKKRGRTK